MRWRWKGEEIRIGEKSFVIIGIKKHSDRSMPSIYRNIRTREQPLMSPQPGPGRGRTFSLTRTIERGFRKVWLPGLIKHRALLFQRMPLKTPE